MTRGLMGSSRPNVGTNRNFIPLGAVMAEKKIVVLAAVNGGAMRSAAGSHRDLGSAA